MTIETKSTPVDIETLFTVILILVDDWYQENAPRLLRACLKTRYPS